MYQDLIRHFNQHNGVVDFVELPKRFQLIIDDAIRDGVIEVIPEDSLLFTDSYFLADEYKSNPPEPN